MFELVRKWLAPPIFPGEEEKNRRARILNALHISLGTAILVFGGFDHNFIFQDTVTSFF